MLLARNTSLALLAALLVGGAALAQPGAEPASDSNWLLPNAELVIKLNVKQLMASDLMKTAGPDAFKKALETNEKAKKAFDATGLDPTKDLDTIVISASGSGAKSPKDVKSRIVVRGRFDAEKITEALKKQADSGPGVKLVKEGSTQMFEFMTREDQVFYGAFADRSTLVLTPSKETTAELVKSGAGRPAVSRLMKTATGRFTGKESMTMALVVSDELRQVLNGMPRGGELAAKLQTLTASLTVTDAIALNLTGATDDAKAAGQMKKMLEALKATGAALLGMDENLPPVAGELLNAVTIGGGRDGVTVNLLISKETIDKAKKLGQ